VAPIAACVVGQVRGFVDPLIYKHSYELMIAPIRGDADVFFALDAQNRPRALPAPLLARFRPVATEWGHANRQCCGAECEGGRVCAAALARVRLDPRCPRPPSPLNFGQQFNLWRAWQLVVDYEQRARGGLRYTWLLRFRPDNLFDRPLPPYATWPAATVPVLYTEGGEEIALSARRCCGRECVGGADHFALATRAAARVYTALVFDRYFTSPSCTAAPRPTGRVCDTHGPAGAIGNEPVSEVLHAHGVRMCKAGLGRALLKAATPAAVADLVEWLESPVNHKPALLLRPLSNATNCPTRERVCT